jgi:Icc-related predicted phosphoesterase
MDLSTPENKNEMIFLHVSDVHGSIQGLNSISDYLFSRKIAVDTVLVTGDLVSIGDGSRGDEVVESIGEGLAVDVLVALENICSKLVFVPGNHDPQSQFAKDPKKLTSSSLNAHMKTVRLGPDLVAVCAGGSVPAYQDGELVWIGYPFATDDGFSKIVKELESMVGSRTSSETKEKASKKTKKGTKDDLDGPPRVFVPTESHVEPDDMIILMTHAGPSDVSTTTVLTPLLRGCSPVVSGSLSLRKMLLQKTIQDRVMINIHGHTHESPGMVTLGSLPVSNSGAVSHGRFSLVRVHRLNPKSPWSLLSVEHVSIHIPQEDEDASM